MRRSVSLEDHSLMECGYFSSLESHVEVNKGWDMFQVTRDGVLGRFGLRSDPW